MGMFLQNVPLEIGCTQKYSLNGENILEYFMKKNFVR